MTTIPRLYVPDVLAAGAVVAASAGQAHHLATVLRCGPHDPVHLFNGRDGEWRARLTTAQRGRVALHVEAQVRPQAPEPDLWLAFALLKRDATDLVVQKATELGAAAVWPVLTDRTNAARTNTDRLTAIATEAAQQCERLTIPAIHSPRRLDELLAGWPPERVLYAAIERSGAPPPHAAAGPAGLLVGPEGGFTPAEVETLQRHPGVMSIGLGPRILRAETASIAGLTLLLLG